MCFCDASPTAAWKVDPRFGIAPSVRGRPVGASVLGGSWYNSSNYDGTYSNCTSSHIRALKGLISVLKFNKHHEPPSRVGIVV